MPKNFMIEYNQDAINMYTNERNYHKAKTKNLTNKQFEYYPLTNKVLLGQGSSKSKQAIASVSQKSSLSPSPMRKKTENRLS